MKMREFVNLLDKKGLLVKIKKPVSTKYEMSTIMKKLDGKPILFEKVKDHNMPVVANICSSKDLVVMGLGIERRQWIDRLADAIDKPKKAKVIPTKDYAEMEADLTKIPILTYYPFDGGPYIASAVIVATDKELGQNVSYHRLMILGKDKIVLRILQRHFDEFLKRGNKEFAICIGNPISIMVSGAISVELGKSEIDIANALHETPVVELGGHKVPEAEIVMIAETTGEMHDEGPFLDLTETADIVRSQRVAKIKKIFVRRNPIYHALLPGGLEHKTLMGLPKEPTIFRAVSKVCECKDVLITPGGCSWLHAIVSIKKKNPDDGVKAIEAAFEGHKSLKHAYIVDDDINIYDPNDVEWAMATRFQGDKNLVIKTKQKGSSLDPSSDLDKGETTKVGFDLTIPMSGGKKTFRRPGLPMELKVEDYLK